MTSTLIAVAIFGACSFVIGYIFGALTAAGARTDDDFDDIFTDEK